MSILNVELKSNEMVEIIIMCDRPRIVYKNNNSFFFCCRCCVGAIFSFIHSFFSYGQHKSIHFSIHDMNLTEHCY